MLSIFKIFNIQILIITPCNLYFSVPEWLQFLPPDRKSSGAPINVQQVGSNTHNLVLIGDRKEKRCHLCRILKCKTKAGWDILTKFKCQECDLPLCSGINTPRECFVKFHQQISEQDSIPYSKMLQL